jgi:hypothetical protein
MDGAVRSNLRFARDAEVRRRMGLPAAVHKAPTKQGDRTRRWDDNEIRRAVLSLTGGRKVSRVEYKRIRALRGPEFPHQDTVATRCPDLFV